MRTILPASNQVVAMNIFKNLPTYFCPLTMAPENSAQELTKDLVCKKFLSKFAEMENQEQNTCFKPWFKILC